MLQKETEKVVVNKTNWAHNMRDETINNHFFAEAFLFISYHDDCIIRGTQATIVRSMATHPLISIFQA